MDDIQRLEEFCAAVPPPDPSQLAAARGQLLTAIRTEPDPARRLREPRLRTVRRGPGRRWPRWAAPLAAAAAVTAVVAGSLTLSSALPHAQTRGAAGPGRGPIAYVATLGGTVVPIRTATKTALRPLHTGNGHDVEEALTADGKTLYVADREGPWVWPVQTATDRVLRPIKVGNHGNFPGDIAITPDSKTAYVSSRRLEGTGPHPRFYLTPIRTATNTALKPVVLPEQADSMAITPDGKTAYVVGLDEVVPVRIATNTALPPIKIEGSLSGGIAIAPDSRTAYVVSDRAVTPIQTATNTTLKPIRLYDGRNIVMAPDGKIAYVLSYSEVAPIQVATNTTLKPIKVNEGSDYGALTPDGQTLYAVSSLGHTITPIRTATGTALRPIRFRSTSLTAIAFSPDGKTGYVVDGTDSVIPLRTATNTLLRPVKVGQPAWAIVLSP